MNRQRASILVGLLWVLALLAVVVIGLLHSSRLDLRVTKNQGDLIQAHYLAVAGIERAKAVVFQDIKSRRETNKHHTGALADDPGRFRETSLGRGRFKVIRPPGPFENGAEVPGVEDEESRLNVNSAPGPELARLPQMPPEVVAAIQDFRDADHTPGPGGVEADYYMTLRPPYMPNDGPFGSLRELLLVKGMDSTLLFGEDANGNGWLDPDENDGPQNPPADNQDGILDTGWSSWLTVTSAAGNLTARGGERVSVQDADESALLGVSGMTSEMAKAIVAHRGRNRIENLLDLLNVPVAGQTAGQGDPGAGAANRPGPPQQPGQQPNAVDPNAPKAISEEQLLAMADSLTTVTDKQQPGVVNINTAPLDVLVCLGLSRELAQSIINHRQSSGFFQHPLGLLKTPGMSQDQLRTLLPRITVRSDTYRITAEGWVPSTGARKRIQEVVRLETRSFRTLSHREDL